MCGRFQLKTDFQNLPDILKKNIPNGLSKRYERQYLIKPGSAILVIKNEGKTKTSLMIWGFISEWAKNPYDNSRPKPFNARSETIDENKLFRRSWRHKRCLIPASGFIEKNNLICRKDSQTFWLGGLWNRWISTDGSELDTCCVITTEPNDLVKKFHYRMPVIIPNGLEEKWISSVKNSDELKLLKPLMKKWNHEGWKAEPINDSNNLQLSFL